MSGVRGLLMVFTLSWLCGAVYAAPPNGYRESLEQFGLELSGASSHSSDSDRAAQVWRAFDRHLSAWVARTDELDADASRRLFRVMHEAYFYTLADNVLEAAEVVFTHLRDTGNADERHAQQMIGMLVGGRRFDKAATLAQEFALPIPLDAVGASRSAPREPKVIHFRPDGRAIVEDWPGAGVRLVAIVHPGCRYSLAAMEQIRQDPDLGSWIAAHGMLLVPQDLTADLRKLRHWALANRDLPIRVAYRRDGFPFFEYWATPNFYIMREGAVVARIEGWPPGTTTAALKAALRGAGAEWDDSARDGPAPH